MKKIIALLMGKYLNILSHIAPRVAAHQGLNLFCRPFRTPLSRYHNEFLDKADSFSLKHNGVHIQGYRWGNGDKKIIFIHGWQSHSFRWKAFIESLSKSDYTLYAIDAPGHGRSGGSFLTVPLYSEVIKQLLSSLGEVHAIVGHSIGSFAAMHAFHLHPNLRVNKLILMAPPGEANDFLFFFKQTLKLSNRCVELISKRFEKTFQKPISYFSTSRLALNINTPGIIIHDKEDLETPYHYAVSINKHWKESQLITTQGLGHNLKSPDVVQHIVSFIEKPLHKSLMDISK